MAAWMSQRWLHYCLVAGLGAAVLFPRLGGSSLWDVDEAINAEAAREMREAETWIVPLFNWELRTAKPALLYWLQRLSYDAFGVNEFAARFPSALLMLLTGLLIYELGRSMFGGLAGLLSATIGFTSLELIKLGRASTPDAPLIFFVTSYLAGFWFGHIGARRSWFIPCGIASGLGVLAKGPIGLAIPAAVVGAYLIWNRELRRLWDRRLISGAAAWTIVAAPWYGLVTEETKGEWTKAFFLNENLRRATEVKESHAGLPLVYYFLCICLFFAPWSLYLWLTFRRGLERAWPVRPPEDCEQRGYRLLLCWFTVVFVAFSIARTQLPNYIATLYPALALLTGGFFAAWLGGQVQPGRRLLLSGIGGTALTGLVCMLGLLAASGTLGVELPDKFVPLRGMEVWVWIPGALLAGAMVMFWAWRKQRPAVYVGALAISTVGFVVFGAAFLPPALEPYRAPRAAVARAGTRDRSRDLQLGSYKLTTMPSLVFYSQRRVESYHHPADAAAHLALPEPAFLFILAASWEREVQPLVRVPYREAGRRYDWLFKDELLVIRNGVP